MSGVDDLNRLLNVVVPFLAIVLVVGCMYFNVGFFDDSPVVYTNVSEHVMGKEIIKDHAFLDHDIHYYVFTDNHCFDCNLTEYNMVHVNDSVVIESCNKDRSMVTGYFNGFSKGTID